MASDEIQSVTDNLNDDPHHEAQYNHRLHLLTEGRLLGHYNVHEKNFLNLHHQQSGS